MLNTHKCRNSPCCFFPSFCDGMAFLLCWSLWSFYAIAHRCLYFLSSCPELYPRGAPPFSESVTWRWAFNWFPGVCHLNSSPFILCLCARPPPPTVLGTEARKSRTLGKSSTAEVRPQSVFGDCVLSRVLLGGQAGLEFVTAPPQSPE